MPHSKTSILIVEENEITRKLLAGILSTRGYNILEAADGDAALNFLGKNPHLVILDVDGDNPHIMGFIRKMQMEHSRLPMIAMSDENDKTSLKNRLGIADLSVLEKPVVPEKLLSNIEHHLVKGVEKKINAEARKMPANDRDLDPELAEKRAAFMRRAIDLSQQKMDENCGGPFGAVIVRAGKVIGEGWNCVTSKNDPTAHAEMEAIRAASQVTENFNLEGCEIYTSCEPCPMCMAAIYWARIDRVYYANTREDAAEIGFDDDFIYRELALPEHRRTLPSKMMLRDEAQIIFDEWVRKGDKTAY